MIKRTPQNLPIETITGAIPGIDSDHYMIHAGRAFSTKGQLQVAANKVGAFLFHVPDDGAAAVTINMTNALADLTYTAREPGTSGNSISVVHLDPAGNNQALAVSVDGKAITVSLATGGAGAITSTAAQVKAAVLANGDSRVLVYCEDEGAGTGIVNAVTATALTGGTDKAYVHFKDLDFSAGAGPSSISILENYTMDAVALAAASAIPAINHNRISGKASIVTVKFYPDITATAINGTTQTTIATIPLHGTSAGNNKVGGDANVPQEYVLKPGSTYLLAFSNAAASPTNFGYKVFWYEETAGYLEDE